MAGHRIQSGIFETKLQKGNISMDVEIYKKIEIEVRKVDVWMETEI